MDFVVFQEGRYPTRHMAYGCVLKGIRVCWQFISSNWKLNSLFVPCQDETQGKLSCFPGPVYKKLYRYDMMHFESYTYIHSWRNQAFNHLLDIYETPSAKKKMTVG